MSERLRSIGKRMGIATALTGAVLLSGCGIDSMAGFESPKLFFVTGIEKNEQETTIVLKGCAAFVTEATVEGVNGIPGVVTLGTGYWPGVGDGVTVRGGYRVYASTYKASSAGNVNTATAVNRYRNNTDELRSQVEDAPDILPIEGGAEVVCTQRINLAEMDIKELEGMADTTPNSAQNLLGGIVYYNYKTENEVVVLQAPASSEL